MLSKVVLFKFFCCVPLSRTKHLRHTTGYCIGFHLVKKSVRKDSEGLHCPLFAVVLQSVEFWVSGFGLVSLPKYLLIYCFSLSFPLTEYCCQMLKVMSLQVVTRFFFYILGSSVPWSSGGLQTQDGGPRSSPHI
jgi:hypothetical protein